MKIVVNGQVLDVPTAADGTIAADTLRRLARIPSNRAFVLQESDGRNHIVGPGEQLTINSESAFVDAPIHTRGATPCMH